MLVTMLDHYKLVLLLTHNIAIGGQSLSPIIKNSCLHKKDKSGAKDSHSKTQIQNVKQY